MSTLPETSKLTASNSPATVTTPSAKVIRSVSSVCPIVVPLIKTSSISKEPPEISPVVVIVEDPVSMLPKPEVMLPESNAPTVVKLAPVSILDSTHVSKSANVSCFIVPPSFIIN